MQVVRLSQSRRSRCSVIEVQTTNEKAQIARAVKEKQQKNLLSFEAGVFVLVLKANIINSTEATVMMSKCKQTREILVVKNDV